MFVPFAISHRICYIFCYSFSFSLQLQWKWETYPICFLPKTLRGAEITDLDANGLDSCLEYITDEEQNAASTSHNFLEAGKCNAGGYFNKRGSI